MYPRKELMIVMKRIECVLGDALFIITGDDVSKVLSQSVKLHNTTHFHIDWEIHIIMNGTALIEIEGNDLQINEGEVCILSPNTSHLSKFYSETIGKASFYFSMVKNDKCIKNNTEFSEYAHYANIFDSVNKYSVVSDPELISITRQLLSEELTSENEHIFCTRLSLFMITLAKRVAENLLCNKSKAWHLAKENSSAFKQRRIVEEFFTERYNDNVCIEDLAKELRLSVPQTHRIVKGLFKDGFKQTLTKLRIEYACTLIRQGNFSLNEIAISCGYLSYNGFLAAFKNHTGKTPKEYEKRYNKVTS
jgi:AraC-like DNA-binding protein